MKKIIFSLSLLSSVIGFAQKAEIRSAMSAFESKDEAKLNAEILKATTLIGDRPYTLEPELQEQYYFLKGISEIRSGKISQGAKTIALIQDMKQIYRTKDASGNRVYYAGLDLAQRNAPGQNISPENYQPKLINNIAATLNPQIQSTNSEAMSAYQNKNFEKGGDKFAELYYLLKAAGQDDPQFLYYAAVNYSQDPNLYHKANQIYDQLIANGYTGVKTIYQAKNKKTGQVESFADLNQFNLAKLQKDAYEDFKTEQSPSIEKDLYEQNAGIYLHNKNYDKALSVIENGLKKFPKSTKLLDLQGHAYYESGKIDQFTQVLKNKLINNPDDIDALYNLGILLSKDETKKAEAADYLKKVLEKDPNHANANMAMFYNIYLGDDAAVIQKAEAARKAKNIKEFEKILADRRERFAKGLPYLEKLYQINPKDKETVSMLKGVYQTLKKEDKVKEMKAIEASL